MEFGQIMIDIIVNVSCKFEMFILKIAQVINENVRTLPPTPNWSPYIFTLVQKVKFGHKKFMLL